MGPEQSRSATGSSFAPVGGARNRDDYIPQGTKMGLRPMSLVTQPIAAPFAGIWSQKHAQGPYPVPRDGQSGVYDEETDSLIIAYGMDASGHYLNDMWRLDLLTQQWVQLSSSLHEPRQYASACLCARQMFIFGGQQGSKYFDDFHVINIDTGEISDISGIGPCARSGACMFRGINSVLIWSGFNGQILNDLYQFSFESMSWNHLPDANVPGRAGPSYCVGSFPYSYVCGSTHGHPIIRFDAEKLTLEIMKCAGTAPPAEIQHPLFCKADEYLFVIGGEKESPYTHVYALKLETQYWLAFHVLPDNITLTMTDGNINKAGLFQLPRQHSGSMVYSRRTRSLVSVMGNLFLYPTPVYSISIGEALGVLHLRNDMVAMMKKGIR